MSALMELPTLETRDDFNLRRWAELQDDPMVRNLIGRVETDRFGKILIEIVSPSNTREEMQEKRRLYFEAGAREFWLCHEGNLSFYLADAEPPAERSALCPDFPARVAL